MHINAPCRHSGYLRARPFQHSLSSYIMDRCRSALPAATPAVLKKAHAGIWTCFVETPVLAFEAGNYSENAAVALHNCTRVMTEDVTMVVLNHLYGTLEPLIQPEARTRPLRSFFEGRDKIHFGFKHLRHVVRSLFRTRRLQWLLQQFGICAPAGRNDHASNDSDLIGCIMPDCHTQGKPCSRCDKSVPLLRVPIGHLSCLGVIPRKEMHLLGARRCAQCKSCEECLQHTEETLKLCQVCDRGFHASCLPSNLLPSASQSSSARLSSSVFTPALALQ